MRGRLRGIFVKNFITVALLFCLSFVILGAAFAGMSYSFVRRERAQAMLESAGTAGVVLRSFAQQWQTDYDDINMRGALSWISSMAGYHIMVTDGQGSILNCSDAEANCPHYGMSVPAGVVSAVNREGSYQAITTLGGAFDAPRFVVGIPLPAGSRPGYLFVSDEAGRISGVWLSFARIFLAAALAVVALSFAVAFFVVRKLSRPIKEMSDAARSYSRGDFTPRVHTDGNDEVAQLAEAFNVMADSLERSERGRREFIANVSHELKTPMTTISGFVDGIIDGAVPPEREREYLQIISSETKRLSRLIRGMLDMSQLQSLTPMELSSRSFNLTEVICQSLISLEQKITDRGLDVDTALPEEPIFAVGDGDAITQVVHNLLDNAAKFSAPGTVITVKLWREEGRAYVSVANRGDTIPKEELPLIFERFHKTDRSRSQDRDGVGLGLYIVKTILDSHGGNIYVTSRDGLTTFSFDLKLAKPRPEKPENDG